MDDIFGNAGSSQTKDGSFDAIVEMMGSDNSEAVGFMKMLPSYRSMTKSVVEGSGISSKKS